MPMSPMEMATFEPGNMPRIWARTRSGLAYKAVKMYHEWTGTEINVNIEPQMGGGDSPDRTERENNIILAHAKKGWLPYPPANPQPPTNVLNRDQIKNMQDKEEFQAIMEAVNDIRSKRAKHERENISVGKATKAGGANAK